MLFCGTKGPRTPNNRLQRTVRCAARRLTGALDGRLRVLPWGLPSPLYVLAYVRGAGSAPVGM